MDKRHFIQACREGGSGFEKALRTLQRDYGSALLREASLSLGDVETARDLAQDTLIKVWQRCAQFRGDSELYPWLKRILRHAVIDKLRARPNEQPLADDQGQPFIEVEVALRAAAGRAAATPEQSVAADELERVYRECLARFAKDHPMPANVIRWIAEDDLTHAEIAALLGRAPGATREYISQCRKKARAYFHAWYLLVAEPGGSEAEAGGAG